jgi:hypothetical protein
MLNEDDVQTVNMPLAVRNCFIVGSSVPADVADKDGVVLGHFKRIAMNLVLGSGVTPCAPAIIPFEKTDPTYLEIAETVCAWATETANYHNNELTKMAAAGDTILFLMEPLP